MLLPSDFYFYTVLVIFVAVFTVLFTWNILELKKTAESKIKLLLATLLLFPVSTYIILVTLSLSIFVFYRLVVIMILKVKHKSTFMGLLHGADLIHMVEKETNDVIQIVHILQCSKETAPQEVFNTLRRLLSNLSINYKFKSEFRQSLGYKYMLNVEDNVDRHIKKLRRVSCSNDKINKEDLNVLISEYYNTPLVDSWEVFIGTQPIDWENADFDYYPLLSRLHHAVADGVTLWKFLIAVLGERQNKERLPETNKSRSKTTFCGKVERVIRFSTTILKAMVLSPASTTANMFLKGHDRSTLHGPSLSNEYVVVFDVEKEKRYVQIIKRIKRNYPGTSFPNVLIAAFSASLEDYFKGNSDTVPESLTIIVPLLVDSDKLRYFTADQVDINEVKADNKYSVVMLEVPVKSRCQESKVLERLNIINDRTSRLKQTVDYYVNYLFMNFWCTYLPNCLIKPLLWWMDFTTVVSIIAEPPKIVGHGLTMSEVIFWVPLLHGAGTSLGIGTYDERLHVGLTADKALIPNEAIARSVIDGLFKYIDILDEEVSRSPKKNYNLVERQDYSTVL